jgi:hypothetical protein
MQKMKWITEKQTYALFSDIEVGSVKEASWSFRRVHENDRREIRKEMEGETKKINAKNRMMAGNVTRPNKTKRGYISHFPSPGRVPGSARRIEGIIRLRDVD